MGTIIAIVKFETFILFFYVWFFITPCLNKEFFCKELFISAA